MVVTFKEHPVAFLNPSKAPKILTPIDEKNSYIGEYGSRLFMFI